MTLRVRKQVETYFPIRKARGKTLGDKVISFIEQLPVHRGRHRVGKKVKLFDFQKEIIRGIHAKGITHSTISIPRKLSKSQIAVWCCLARMLMPELQQSSAQLIAVSVTTKQADLLFNSIVDILDQLDPDTIDDVRVRSDNSKKITVPEKGIRFQVVSSDKTGSKLQGFDVNFAVIDEPGSMTSPQTYLSLKAGSPNGELLLIGTQCHLPEAENHWYTQLLKDTDLPNHHYRYFLGATKQEADKQWEDKELWKRLTPALEIKPMSYLEAEYKDAKKFHTEKNFLTAHLNALVPSLSNELTIYTEAELDACWQPNSGIAKGSQVIMGIDLAQVSDLCAVVLLDPKTGATESYFFVPQKAVAESPNVPYHHWQTEGFLEIVADRCISFESVVEKILEFQQTFHVLAICRDHWLTNQFQMVADRMGVSAPSHSVKQVSADVGKATKQLQIYVKSKKLKINNPCLRWNMDCSRFSSDTHGNIRIHKQLSMTRAKGHRVDGALALCNAFWYVSEHEIVSSHKGFFIGELG